MVDEPKSQHSASQLIEQLSGLRSDIDENTKATLAMSNSLKMINTLFIAIVAMGLTSGLFWFQRISEMAWLTMMIISITPFFGEHVTNVLSKAPLLGKIITKTPLGVILFNLAILYIQTLL